METVDTDNNIHLKNRIQLPNSTAVLVLGIISLVFCWCCWFGAIISFTLSVVALVLAYKSHRMYKDNPELYKDYNNLLAGMITAIIGLVISVLWIIAVIIVGIAALTFTEIFNSLR